ncbi:MAG: hypothetical protein R3Y63_07580 [Eubacteriales bacterium]
MSAWESHLEPHLYPTILKDELYVADPEIFSYNGKMIFLFSPLLKLREPFVQAVFRQFKKEHQLQILRFFSVEDGLTSFALGESILLFYQKGVQNQLTEPENAIWKHSFSIKTKEKLLEWECCVIEMLELCKPLNMKKFETSFLSTTGSYGEYVNFLLFSAYKECSISSYQLQWFEKLCYHYGLSDLWFMRSFKNCEQLSQNQREQKMNSFLRREDRASAMGISVKRKDVYFLENLRRYAKNEV